MAGQLLGYKVEDIARLMPAIEAFAEIGDYIDQPVRDYSIAMQIRLAFSAATAHRPAVCDRAILLNAEKLALEGEPEAVMDYYNGMLAERENKTVHQHATEDGKVQTVSGTGEVALRDIVLLNENNERLEANNVRQLVKLKVVTYVATDIPELVLGYMIKDRLGQPVFGTNTHHLKSNLFDLKRGVSTEFIFRFAANLGPGTYSVAIALHASDTHIARNYEWRDLALIFNVINIDREAFVGVAWLPPTLEIAQ